MSDNLENNGLMKLAIAIMLAPFVIALIALGISAIYKGDWQFGIILLAMLPLSLASHYVQKKFGLEKIHRLKGREKHLAEFKKIGD